MAKILSQDKSPGIRLLELLRYFADPENAVEGFMDIFCYSNVYSDRQPIEIMGTLLRAWHDVALLPEISDWGRKQYMFSGFEKTVSSRVIDFSEFRIDIAEDAQEYWTQQTPEIAFDEDKYLDAGDMPANVRELREIWELNPPDIDPEQADEVALRLLEEASAIRHWTIPPRAHVELAFGHSSRQNLLSWVMRCISFGGQRTTATGEIASGLRKRDSRTSRHSPRTTALPQL